MFSELRPAGTSVHAGDDQLSVGQLELGESVFVKIGGVHPRMELVDHCQGAALAGSDEISDEFRLALEVLERCVRRKWAGWHDGPFLPADRWRPATLSRTLDAPTSPVTRRRLR